MTAAASAAVLFGNGAESEAKESFLEGTHNRRPSFTDEVTVDRNFRRVTWVSDVGLCFG
jgi:hypothetical protein